MEARSILILSFIAALLVLLPGQVFAYDDALGAHSKINSLALSQFQTDIMPADPYLKNAYLDNTPTMGIAWDPTDGSKFTPPEVAIQRTKTLKLWVIDGGYSADEPEATMALCHFYDPTQPAGQRYLTDQQFIVNFVKKFNSEYANPEIDAVQWAFHGDQYGTVFDQQYSWDQGKGYLKSALESTDPHNVNYGKAWRSLGETMHLMADMTVPAHVRNDGHASLLLDPDPYESTTTWQLVDSNKGYPAASDIDYGQSPERLMVSVATYTNSHFMSKDTIPVPAGVTSPWHYSQPSVSGLTPSASGYLYQTINGENLRIAKTRSLSSYLLSNSNAQYMIDDNVCNDQREVLIPTAIKADATLVSDFMPRFQVTEQVASSTTGSGYTMAGSIKGIDQGEWIQISSVKIRNGARIVVTDAKTGKETVTQVKLTDPSGDLNSFSYDFSANPGDTVRLEYDLGGYVIKSDDAKIPGGVPGSVRTPDRAPRKVIIPQAPSPLQTKTDIDSSTNTKSVYTYYETANNYGVNVQTMHGNDTTYYANGKVWKESTYAFGKPIGYERVYDTSGNLHEEIYYGDNSVRHYQDWMQQGAWIKDDYYPDGNTIKDEFSYNADGSLGTYDEYSSAGQKTLEESYRNGKLWQVWTYSNGQQVDHKTYD